MIIMRVKIDNICQFNDFDVNFSYPKKIVNSTIEQEFLKDRPNFRYKKLVILMGQNASGKTTFGKVLMVLFNAMKNRDFDSLYEMIADRNRQAYIMIEFILRSNTLYRFEVQVGKNSKFEQDRFKTNEDDFLPEPFTAEFRLKKCEIKEADNYEKCVSKLDKQKIEFTGDLSTLKKEKMNMGWFFTFSEDGSKSFSTSDEDADEYLTILSAVLKAIDTSIDTVQWLKIGVGNNKGISISIKNESRAVLIYENKIVNEQLLSSGTMQAIKIAQLISSAKLHRHGLYYCDEQFSFIQTEFEIAILSLLTGCIDDREQLFFTTHNYEILDMSLPKHSFAFLDKKVNDDKPFIKMAFADSIMKKNSDSLKNAYENDLFSVLPSVDAIYELGADIHI